MGPRNWSLDYDLRYCFVRKTYVQFSGISQSAALALAISPSQNNMQNANLILFHPSSIHLSLNFPSIINSNMLTIMSNIY